MRTECQRIIIHFLLRISHKSLAIARQALPPSIFAPRSLPNRSPDESCVSLPYASVYPPIFDALEWMEMQTGLPLYGLLKLCC